MRPRENKITFLFCDIARLQVFLANIYSENTLWYGWDHRVFFYLILLYDILL